MSEAMKKNNNKPKSSKNNKPTTSSVVATTTSITPTTTTTTTTTTPIINTKPSITKSEEPIADSKPKYTPGSYVPVKQTTFISGKVWKQPKERFSVKKTRSVETYEQQMKKKNEMKEIKELEAKIKADMEEENKIEKRKMEQRRQARIEKIIKENKNKPLKQGRGKCRGRNKKLTDKDVHRVKIFHETQGLF